MTVTGCEPGFGVSRGWVFNVALRLVTFLSSPSALVLSSAINIRASQLRITLSEQRVYGPSLHKYTVIR